MATALPQAPAKAITPRSREPEAKATDQPKRPPREASQAVASAMSRVFCFNGGPQLLEAVLMPPTPGGVCAMVSGNPLPARSAVCESS